MSGCLVCITGPSGAGKDSLMDYCQKRLAGDADYVFARRVVTRETGAHEDHETLHDAAFVQADMNGEFFLSWRAHGLAYGLRNGVVQDVEEGRTVIANLSRAVLGADRLRHLNCHIVSIAVRPEILLERLLNRGRESESDATLRLSRPVPPLPDYLRHTRIDNSGTLEVAGEQLLAVLRACRA